MSRISVLLVDDHAVVREGLRALLECEPDLEVVGEAAEGREALALARKLSPEVVVMDISMPVMNGLEATRLILKSVPDARVLVLTSYGDEDCVAQMTKAGALGYVTKQTAANDLVKAIREVRRGNSFYSPSIAKRLREQVHSAAELGSPNKKATGLTRREVQVLQHIAEGFSNKETAAKLKISVKTVEKHRQSVMNKLNIHEVATLTRYAINKGVIETEAPVGSVAGEQTEHP